MADYPNGGWAAQTFGINFPPYTHGRVVCKRGHLVARCGCSEACKVVATVDACFQCADEDAAKESTNG